MTESGIFFLTFTAGKDWDNWARGVNIDGRKGRGQRVTGRAWNQRLEGRGFDSRENSDSAKVRHLHVQFHRTILKIGAIGI